jgi:superfamily II DNA helicase RecQ
VAIVVCTSAFGLGINNLDLRWVLHFQPPLTLSEYVQETGRAGRDGNPAQALLLVSEPTGILDKSDRGLHAFFQKQQQNHQNQALAMVQQLPKHGNHAEVIRNLAGNDHQNSDRLALGLAILHSMGKLVWRDPHDYELVEQAVDRVIETAHNTQNLKELRASAINRNARINHQVDRKSRPRAIDQLLKPIVALASQPSKLINKITNRTRLTSSLKNPEQDRHEQAIAQMQAYANDQGCRWAFILAAFGFDNR